MRGNQTSVDEPVGEMTNAQAFQRLPSLELLIQSSQASDSELAATIFEDGRRRRNAGMDISLSDYLRAVPSLPSRELALDAAIGVCVGRYHANAEERSRRAAVERERHPELASAIDLALCLDQLMGSPDVSLSKSSHASKSALPTDIGPLLEDGKPRYVVRRVIGQGANSSVVEAEDRLLSESSHSNRVAIKIFQRDEVDPELFERTVAEARKARSIQHHGVIRVLDVGKEGTIAYIVQEHVPSETLESWLLARGRQTDTRLVIKLIRDIASALASIHAAGIWHRDLKPANVLVTPQGQVKIVDFGASRTRDTGVSSSPGSASVGGTLAFMAPEQFNLEQSADSPAADIYSLGAIMFWIFVGTSPNGMSRLDAIASLSEGAPKHELDLALAKSGLCPQLSQIILRALSHHPADRHSSADNLAADLDAWLTFKPIEWQRPGIARRARLLLRRRPLTIALSCVFVSLVTAGIFGWTSALRAEEIAREHKFAADIAQARVEEEIKWKSLATDRLAAEMLKFPRAINDGLAAEVLTSLWIYEWAHGPTVFESPEQLDTIWKERINVVEDIQARFKSKHEASTVSSEMLSPSLALWYIRAGDPARAESLLAESEAYWASKTIPTDPWIHEIRSLSAAARLLRRLNEVCAAPDINGQTVQQQIATEIDNVRSLVAQNQREYNMGPVAIILKDALTKATKATRDQR